MTIALRAAGTVSEDTTSPSPSYPAGVQVTDINILTVTAKPNSGVLPANVTISVPSGWTSLYQGRAGNFAPGTPEGGSGGTVIAVFSRSGGAYTGSVPITLTNHSVAAAVIDTYSGSGGWSASATFGYDASNESVTTYDSNKTVTSANLLTAPGDLLIVASALSNGNGVGTVALTATGSTLASSTGTQRHSTLSRVTSPDQADVWIDVRDVAISSGTSTAGPRMMTTTVQDGISVFIRLREGIVSINGAETVSTLEKSSLGATDDLPVIKEWANGDDLDAATLNAHLRDPIAWMMTNAPEIQLEATTPVTFTTTSHTVTWNTTPRHRRGSIVVNGTKLVVPTTGFYLGEISVGIKDLDAMGSGWLLTLELLMYPGGTGTANVQNISVTFMDLLSEASFTVGSVPFSFYLNAGDAIEARISGAWGTTADTGLWTDQTGFSVLNMIDLRWQGMWEGGTI